MSNTESQVLSDNSRFDIEREFFCTNCNDFRDVYQNQNDIVCDDCHSIIATFKDRQVAIAKADSDEVAA